MYANEFPARIFGDILRAKICKYGVEGYTEGADFLCGGNDATPKIQHETWILDKQLKLLYHQLNMLMSRTMIFKICQKIFMIGSKIDPCKHICELPVLRYHSIMAN